jgi:MerR family copper efflux transcriptional regulator
MPAIMNEPKRQSGGLMTIGEASRRSGFTIKALRFYERRGILPPANRRPNGYRVYCGTDLGRLSFIRDAKALGLTLGAISGIVKSSNGSRRRRLLRVLDDRIAESTERIAALTRLRNELELRRRTVVRRPHSDGSGEYCTCLKKTNGSG